jgi:DNA-binding response OmpR family regulator
MRHPQILVYEKDGRIAGLLRKDASDRRWSLREPRRPESCLRLLRASTPSICILRVGADVVRELTLLDQVAWLCQDVAIFAVSDAENPALSSLAWELGATYVHAPPSSRGELPSLVVHAMESLIASMKVFRRPPRHQEKKEEAHGSEG